MIRAERHPVLTSVLNAACVVVCAPGIALFFAYLTACQRWGVRRGGRG